MLILAIENQRPVSALGIKTEMKTTRSILLLFLGAWLLLNLLQAGLTELDPDEAYYWAYAQELDWGYFDHPPMIALMIRIGSTLLPGELGVRLMTILLSALSLYLMWVLVGRPRERGALLTIMALLAAMPFLHVYGFVATPDSPLIFFTVLFFLTYQRFLRSGNWLNTLAWGACMAGLLYSKYHGVLIIGFTVLSNLQLLRRPKFYLAALWGALLFLPHLLWQIDNHFPSFRYHLMERNNVFEWKDLYSYLINQLVIFNPFIFPLLVAALIKRKPSEDNSLRTAERAYTFTIIGFWLFFFAMIIRGHVEPQWTAVLSIPLVALAYRYGLGRPRYQRRLRNLVLVSLLPILAFRVLIMKGVLEERIPLFHKRHWVYELEKEVGDLPVLFLNTFRGPSTYEFYTGNEAVAVNTITAVRNNQYSLWDRGKILQGERIVVLGDLGWPCEVCREVSLDGKARQYEIVDDFQAGMGLEFHILEVRQDWQAGATQRVLVEIHNPYGYDIRLRSGELPVRPVALFNPEPEVWRIAATRFELPDNLIKAGERRRVLMEFDLDPDWEGDYLFTIGVQIGNIPPLLPEAMISVQVEGLGGN